MGLALAGQTGERRKGASRLPLGAAELAPSPTRGASWLFSYREAILGTEGLSILRGACPPTLTLSFLRSLDLRIPVTGEVDRARMPKCALCDLTLAWLAGR